jgi:hypothetical protein
VNKFRGLTRNLNSVNRIECPDAEWATGPSLAGETMACDNQFWRFSQHKLKSAAKALSVGHGKSSV